MRIREFIDDYDDDEEGDEPNYDDLPSVKEAEALRPELAQVAQAIYDKWDEEDIDTYAGGGICHYIADAFVDILYSRLQLNCQSVTSSHEQHVYVAAQFQEGVYVIDLHHSYYETGGGFSWKKIPDVEIDPRDIDFYRASPNPGDYEEYVGDY